MLKHEIKKLARKIYRPFENFFHLQASGGILLVIFSLIAILWANLPFSDIYFNFWHQELVFGYGSFIISKPLLHWVNDGLMAVFFFMVGLEIKREILAGELSVFKEAMLPVVAALGGMLFPALFFLLQMYGKPGHEGWGIPMATDIAFSIGILSLLGSRVPLSLKVFLTTLAVVDDIGAIIVIAIFYNHNITWDPVIIAGILTLILILMNYINIRVVSLYVIIGIVMWYFFLKANIHPTIAGVITAFTIPARRKVDSLNFKKHLYSILKEFENNDTSFHDVVLSNEQQGAITEIEKEILRVQSPLQQTENMLHPLVINVIMPLFAFANASVVLIHSNAEIIISNLTIAVGNSLVIGKVIGITFFTWLSVKLKLTSLPRNLRWEHIIGVSFLGGIGFTMSLFINSLAYSNELFINQAKIGIFATSFVTSFIGYYLLKWKLPKKTTNGNDVNNH